MVEVVNTKGGQVKAQNLDQSKEESALCSWTTGPNGRMVQGFLSGQQRGLPAGVPKPPLGTCRQTRRGEGKEWKEKTLIDQSGMEFALIRLKSTDFSTVQPRSTVPVTASPHQNGI